MDSQPNLCSLCAVMDDMKWLLSSESSDACCHIVEHGVMFKP